MTKGRESGHHMGAVPYICVYQSGRVIGQAFIGGYGKSEQSEKSVYLVCSFRFFRGV
jgi:hypothetical protein